MSYLVIVKDSDGKLRGLGDKGERAYARFRAAVESMCIGDTMRFCFWLPRSPQHHRLFFAKLNALFDRQEQFDDEDKLRAWLTVGAGYCDILPGPNGRMVAIPQSIAWHKLDEAAFTELHARVDAFLWTSHARQFLWGHLSDEQSLSMVDAMRMEFS